MSIYANWEDADDFIKSLFANVQDKAIADLKSQGAKFDSYKFTVTRYRMRRINPMLVTQYQADVMAVGYQNPPAFLAQALNFTATLSEANITGHQDNLESISDLHYGIHTGLTAAKSISANAVVGGWGPLHSPSDDENKILLSVESAIIARIRTSPTELLTGLRGITVQSQIVNGTNYRFYASIVVSNPPSEVVYTKDLIVEIYVPINGSAELTSVGPYIPSGPGPVIPPITAKDLVVGGYSSPRAPTKEDLKILVSVENDIIAKIRTNPQEMFSDLTASTVETQIVDGTNYRFQATIKDTIKNIPEENILHLTVIIFHPFHGHNVLVSVMKNLLPIMGPGPVILPGGWTPVRPAGKADQAILVSVQDAIFAKIRSSPSEEFRKLTALKVQTQIVAGVNYKFSANVWETNPPSNEIRCLDLLVEIFVPLRGPNVLIGATITIPLEPGPVLNPPESNPGGFTPPRAPTGADQAILQSVEASIIQKLRTNPREIFSNLEAETVQTQVVAGTNYLFNAHIRQTEPPAMYIATLELTIEVYVPLPGTGLQNKLIFVKYRVQ